MTTASVDVTIRVGWPPSAYLVVRGTVTGTDHAGFARAELPVVGRIGSNVVTRTVLARVTVGEGDDTIPSSAGDIVWSRAIKPGHTLLAWNRTTALNGGPSQDVTVLGWAPPATAHALALAGLNDQPASFVTRYNTYDGLPERSGEDSGTPTNTLSYSGTAPELNETLPELVPQRDDWEKETQSVGARTPLILPPNVSLEDARRRQYLRSLPTRRAVAEKAASEVGMRLVWIDGPQLPTATQRVPPGYATGGRTLRSVLADLILNSGCPWWTEDGTIYALGTTLPHAGALPPIPDYRTSDGPNAARVSWEDDDTGVRGRDEADAPPDEEPPPPDPAPAPGDPVDIGEPTLPPFVSDNRNTEPRPNLEDYLAECGYEAPATGGGFQFVPPPDFENTDDITMNYVTKAGMGEEFTITYHTLTKENGVVTYQSQEEYGYKEVVNMGPGQEGVSTVFGPTRKTVAQHVYGDPCPDALVHTMERTWRWPTANSIQGAPEAPVPEDAPPWRMTDMQAWWNAMPKPYLDTMRRIDNTWSREGWLHERAEARRAHSGFTFIKTPHPILDDRFTFQAILLYKRESKTEGWNPSGRGLWHIDVREQLSEMKPVLGNPDPDIPGDIEVVGVQTSFASYGYTIVTDQAPSQVTCGGVTGPGPGGIPGSDCLEDARERYLFDLDTWRRRVKDDPDAILDDPLNPYDPNDPDFPPHLIPDPDMREDPVGNLDNRRIWTYRFARFRPDLRVGAVVGGALVASVQHQWRDGSPITTTATLWARA